MKNLKGRIIVKKIDKKIDERGYFEVLIDGSIIKNDKFGSVIITTANPGKIKGNHYHKINEDYGCVIEGKALLVCVDVITEEKAEIMLDGENPVLFYIPVNVSHAIKNIGNKMMIAVEYSTLVFEDKIKDIHEYIVVR